MNKLKKTIKYFWETRGSHESYRSLRYSYTVSVQSNIDFERKKKIIFILTLDPTINCNPLR